MKLYIKLQDGNPIDHPIMHDNFVQAFPNIDTNNLPEDFIEFVRVPHPTNLDLYEVYDGVHYEIIDGVCKDVHTVRTMTNEERIAKQNEVKEDWAKNGYPSWIFNDGTCSFESPLGSPPPDGKIYKWDEDTVSWVEASVE
jgi:hypothetical protein